MWRISKAGTRTGRLNFGGSISTFLKLLKLLLEIKEEEDVEDWYKMTEQYKQSFKRNKYEPQWFGMPSASTVWFSKSEEEIAGLGNARRELLITALKMQAEHVAREIPKGVVVGLITDGTSTTNHTPAVQARLAEIAKKPQFKELSSLHLKSKIQHLNKKE